MRAGNDRAVTEERATPAERIQCGSSINCPPTPDVPLYVLWPVVGSMRAYNRGDAGGGTTARPLTRVPLVPPLYGVAKPLGLGREDAEYSPNICDNQFGG